MEKQELGWSQRHPFVTNVVVPLVLIVVLAGAIIISPWRKTTKAMAEFERIRSTPVAGINDPLLERWQRSKNLARFCYRNSLYLKVQANDICGAWANPDDPSYITFERFLNMLCGERSTYEVGKEQRICRAAKFKRGLWSAKMRIKLDDFDAGLARDEEVFFFLCTADLDDKAFARLWTPVYTRWLVPWFINHSVNGFTWMIDTLQAHPRIGELSEEALEQIMPACLKGQFEPRPLPDRREYIKRALEYHYRDGGNKSDEELVIAQARKEWERMKAELPAERCRMQYMKEECVFFLRSRAIPLDWVDQL